MSDASTSRLISAYLEESEAPLFLAGFFQTPPQNIHNGEKVEIDVMRDDEDVAIVVTDVSAGPRANESTLYTNKAFTPPIYDEKGAISAYELLRRQPGANPFDDPDYAQAALSQSFNIFRKLERKIRRAIELQASQVLQTGKLSLTDQTGSVLYALDFSPKGAHFVTTTPWAADGSTGDPLTDLGDMCTTIRRNGKKIPTRAIYGRTAMQRFLANAKVQKQLDNRAMATGQIAPAVRGGGATFQGYVWVGHYRIELWMYDGYFRDPVTGQLTPYVGDTKVIVMCDGARLDLSFGNIPIFTKPEARALPFLPSRIVSTDRGIAMTTNSWVTDDGKAQMVSAGTRPLCIPTAIDTFGCLTVA